MDGCWSGEDLEEKNSVRWRTVRRIFSPLNTSTWFIIDNRHAPVIVNNIYASVITGNLSAPVVTGISWALVHKELAKGKCSRHIYILICVNPLCTPQTIIYYIWPFSNINLFLSSRILVDDCGNLIQFNVFLLGGSHVIHTVWLFPGIKHWRSVPDTHTCHWGHRMGAR